MFALHEESIWNPMDDTNDAIQSTLIALFSIYHHIYFLSTRVMQLLKRTMFHQTKRAEFENNQTRIDDNFLPCNCIKDALNEPEVDLDEGDENHDSTSSHVSASLNKSSHDKYQDKEDKE